MSSSFDSSPGMALSLSCSPLGSMFPGYPAKAPSLTFWSNGYHLNMRGDHAASIHEHPTSPSSPVSNPRNSESSSLVPMHSSAFHAAPPSLPYRLYPMNQPHSFLPTALFPRDLYSAFPAMPPVFSSGLPIMPRASFYSRASVKPGSSERHGSVSPRDVSQGFDEPKNCHICGKSYARLSTLRLHLRTHSGVKPYQCMVCLKSFTQAANLTAHFRIHSGEKPFRCRVCGRQFSQSSSVTTHMRTHNGERPYKCKVCNKAFADSSTLTKHVRTHTGEKPYQCEICLQRFSQSGNMNRHKRIHEM